MHSYGTTEGTLWNLAWACAIALRVSAIGCVPLMIWPSLIAEQENQTGPNGTRSATTGSSTRKGKPSRPASTKSTPTRGLPLATARWILTPVIAAMFLPEVVMLLKQLGILFSF